MRTIILPTVCVKEEWTFLYCFIPLQTSASHAIVTWSAGASLRHVWLDSPHWKMGKDAPLIFQLAWLTYVYTLHCIPYSHRYVNETLQICRLPVIIYFIYRYYVLRNKLKWHAFTPASVHSTTPSRVSQVKRPTKIIRRRAVKGKNKSPWKVSNSSPTIQKKKLKAKRRKHNFKKMVHNPNSNNADKNDEADCCE
jgi:hypothetical protein